MLGINDAAIGSVASRKIVEAAGDSSLALGTIPSVEAIIAVERKLSSIPPQVVVSIVL